MCRVSRRSPRSSRSSAASRTILLTRPLFAACVATGPLTPLPPGAETPISGSAGDEEPQHHLGATSRGHVTMAKMHKLNGGGRAGGGSRTTLGKDTKVLRMKVYPVLPEDAEVFGCADPLLAKLANSTRRRFLGSCCCPQISQISGKLQPAVGPPGSSPHCEPRSRPHFSSRPLRAASGSVHIVRRLIRRQKQNKIKIKTRNQLKDRLLFV